MYLSRVRGVARRGVANTLSGVTTAAAGGRTAGPGRAWLVRMRVLSVGRAAAHHYALVAVLSCTVTRSPSAHLQHEQYLVPRENSFKLIPQLNTVKMNEKSDMFIVHSNMNYSSVL